MISSTKTKRHLFLDCLDCCTNYFQHIKLLYMKLRSIVLFCFLSTVYTTVFAQVDVQDSLALVDLYNKTNALGWNNHANWLTTMPLADWFGITVSGNRVTKINIRANGLSGSIPASLGKLTSLQTLDLGSNTSLSGSIPHALGKLVNLQILNLDNASLIGSIPPTLGKLIQLQVLNLFNNKLSGHIPSSLGQLVNLQKLYLNRNQLTGAIPASLGNLAQLSVFYLEANQLKDTIPSSLGNLSNLTQMILNNNQLTGPIPASFGNLSNLQNISLYINQLSGAIPASLGNLKNLRFFQASNNQLSGSIPDSLGSLTGLILLNLSNNQLSGTIPSSFTNLPALQEMFLNNNYLSGALPDYVGDMLNLTHLYLSGNHLSGSIPSSLGNLKHLLFLVMDNNFLSGKLPGSLANLASLYYLDLSHNLLTDTIPVSLTSLTNLQFLFLQNNYFTFNGLEQLVKTLSIAMLTYSPQGPIKLHHNDNTLSVSAGGILANDKFYWYKDDQLIKTIAGDSTFTITEPGAYHVEITNSIATDLPLNSDTLEISVLPVDLIAFTAEKRQTTVALNWKTTNEINNSHFDIERSFDSKMFYSIGTVKGLNSTNMNNYFFIDSTPLNGINYYRLKQVDKDGMFNYSGIAFVEFISGISIFTLSPNPADNNIKISIPASNSVSQIIIYDLTGRKVINEEVAAHLISKQINISRLTAGSYYVILKQPGRQQTLKLIKK